MTAATREATSAVRVLDATLDDFVSALAWSPEGQALAATTLAGTSHVWRRGELRPLSVRSEGGAFSVAWSPDGTRLAIGAAEGCVHLYDGVSLRLERTVAVGLDWVTSVVWSHDGSRLGAASGKRVAFLAPDGETLGSVDAHASTVTSLVWRGETLLSSCYGGVHFLESGRPTPTRSLAWKGSILTMSLSRDERWVATGNQDGSVHVWEIASGSDLEMSGYETKVSSIAWGERGPLLATAGGRAITLWSFAGRGPAGSHPVELSGHKARVTGLAFAKGGDRLFSIGDDGVFHVAERHPSWRSAFADATGPSSRLSSLATTRDGRHCAAAGSEGRLFAWMTT